MPLSYPIPFIRFSYLFLIYSFLFYPLTLFASDALNQQGVDAYQKEQFSVAREKFRLACNADTYLSCSHYADMLYRGLGGEKNLAKARETSKQACDANMHYGCALLAHMTRYGQGGSQDQTASFNLYVKSCHIGNASACQRAAYMAHVGEGKSVDKSHALNLYRFACLGGNANGCESLAQYFISGDGVKKNEEKARIYLDQGCTYGSARSCFNFAAYNELGTGGVTDDIVARNAFKKSCDLSDTDGCAQYARYLRDGKGGEQDLSTAEAMYKTLCESDEQKNCMEFAEALDDNRRNNQVDNEQVLALLKQLCTEGTTRACSKGLVSRLYRLPEHGSSLSKVRQYHFDNKLFSSIMGVQQKEWSNESEYASLLQTVEKLFNDIFSRNTFTSLQKVVPTDLARPVHGVICSNFTSVGRTEIYQLSVEKAAALQLQNSLIDLQRNVINNQQAELNNQASVLDKQARALQALKQSRGWDVVANISLVESDLTLRNLKNKYSSLNAIKEDLRHRRNITEAAIAKIDSRVKQISDQLEQPCVVTEYHWVNSAQQQIIITALEQEHKSIIASVEIPDLNFTLPKLYRQLRDPETLKITQSIDSIKSLLTYSSYSN